VYTDAPKKKNARLSTGVSGKDYYKPLAYFRPGARLLCVSGCLGFLDILTPRPLLSRGWLGVLRDIRPRFGFEAVASHVNGLCAQLINDILRIFCIRDEFAVLDVRVLFAN
jgi:hypothetical protein